MRKVSIILLLFLSCFTAYSQGNGHSEQDLCKDAVKFEQGGCVGCDGLQQKAENYDGVLSSTVLDSTPSSFLALKTNLLFDAVTALNFELEIPLHKSWSLAAELIFPWWTTCGNKGNGWQSSSDRRNTFQLLNANIEGKYWFGNREQLPVMTGWFAGVYVGGGLYDLEREARGYQGEFFIAAGLSGGYAHTINCSGSLRMEYSLGVGYLKTKYRYYEEHFGIDDQWHTLRKQSGNYTWVGPTRLKVSLVWMLNKKSK